MWCVRRHVLWGAWHGGAVLNAECESVPPAAAWLARLSRKGVKPQRVHREGLGCQTGGGGKETGSARRDNELGVKRQRAGKRRRVTGNRRVRVRCAAAVGIAKQQ